MSRQKANLAYRSFEKLLSALIATRVEFVQVGKRIREIREKELGLGQKAFAHKIGKTQTDVSHYEKGERIKDRAEALLRIAKLDPKKRGIRWLLGGYSALVQSGEQSLGEAGGEAGGEAVGGVRVAESAQRYASPEDQRWQEAAETLLSIRYHQPPSVQRLVLDHIALLGRIQALTSEE